MNDNTWFGKISDNWGVARIGSLYTLRNTKVSDKDFAPLSVTKKTSDHPQQRGTKGSVFS